MMLSASCGVKKEIFPIAIGLGTSIKDRLLICTETGEFPKADVDSLHGDAEASSIF
jgi:hypothetical protein